MSNPAEMYEHFLVPAMFRPLTSHIIDIAAPQTEERVLDVACGTGIVARRIARHLDGNVSLVGVDLNPLMLGVARDIAEESGLKVEWQECSAESLPFPDRVFDLVTCQHGLQFVPDRSRALAEMCRVLDERGRAIAITWRGLDHHPFFAELDAACTRQIGTNITGDPFSLGDTGQLTELFTRAGFDNIEIHPFSFTASYADPDLAVALIVRSATAAVPSLGELSPEQLEALLEAVQEDMADTTREYIVGDQLEVPMHAIATLGRKPTMN